MFVTINETYKNGFRRILEVTGNFRYIYVYIFDYSLPKNIKQISY